MNLNTKLILAFIFGLVLVSSSIIKIGDTDDDSSAQNQNNGNNEKDEKDSEPSNQQSDSNPETNQNTDNISLKGSKNRKKQGIEMSWEDFKNRNGKKYDKNSESSKKANFQRNKKALEKSDCESCGVNELFDLSETEIAALKGTIPQMPRSQILDAIQQTSNNGARLLQAFPSSFDWRTYSVVTAVKNQGGCGSCWAFAATAFLESQGIRRKKFSRSNLLSDQYLYWCTASGTYRCNGGDPFRALNYGIARGMPWQATYPYRIGYDYTGICTSPIISPSATFGTSGRAVWTYSTTTKSLDSVIIQNLLQRPILLALDADDMLYYKFNSTLPINSNILSCSIANSGSAINHAVLLVGYTSLYWIIKNSWGTGWGHNGYVYVTRDRTRNCGIGHYWGTVTSNLTRVV